MKSMTGYEFKSFRMDKIEYQIELKSYNSKGLEFSIRLPEEFAFLEADIREAIKKYVRRGKIYLKISSSSEETVKPVLSEDFFVENIKKIESLKKKTGMNIDPSFLLSKREAFVSGKIISDEEKVKKEVMKNIDEACVSFDSFRKREGKKHSEDITKSLKAIEKNIKKVEKILPSSIESIKARYNEKFSDFIEAGSPFSDRVFQEIAMLVDKADVNEEMVRFKEHLDFFKKSIKNSESGKKMVFITQEMIREMNTMGVKCGDTSISHLVVENKNEIEKIRELLMNIE